MSHKTPHTLFIIYYFSSFIFCHPPLPPQVQPSWSLHHSSDMLQASVLTPSLPSSPTSLRPLLKYLPLPVRPCWSPSQKCSFPPYTTPYTHVLHFSSLLYFSLSTSYYFTYHIYYYLAYFTSCGLSWGRNFYLFLIFYNRVWFIVHTPQRFVKWIHKS